MHNKIVINNAKTEFVLTGGVAGKTDILVQSKYVDSELMDVAFPVWYQGEEHCNQGTLKLLLGKRRKYNFIRCSSMPDLYPEIDHRKSEIHFAWSGMVSNKGRRRICDNLNTSMIQLWQHIKNNDQASTELLINSTIEMCAKENEKSKRIYIATRSLIIISFVIIVFCFIQPISAIW